MKTFLKKAVLGATLAASAVTAAAPASAQYYRHYRHDDTGAAIAGGVVGLALGAAIASGADRDRDYWYSERGYRPDYDSYYYRGHGYYPTNGYYASRYDDYDYRRCWTENRWDPYYGSRVRIRVCN